MFLFKLRIHINRLGKLYMGNTLSQKPDRSQPISKLNKHAIEYITS